MRPYGAWRRRGSWVLRWCGPLILLLIIASFAVSVRWGLGWHTDHGPSFYANRGGLHLSWNDFPPSRSRNTGWIVDDNYHPKLLKSLGPITLWLNWYRGMGEATLVLPHWVLLVLASAPTGLAWRRWSRRYRPGLCPSCSYSLAGLTPGAPCPECGRRDAQPTS